jgi:glycopeptide antibiotics resistance protein
VTRRLALLLLGVLFVAFAAYGSFVPLRLRYIGLGEAVQQFAATPLIPLSQASRSDFITNVLLFVPIGFLLLGAFANRSRGLAVGLFVPIVAIAIALSVAIEFGQTFVRGRTPSWNDVVAESLGAGIGAVVWVAVGNAVVDWLAALFRSESESDRVYRILGAYVGVWTMLGLLPFDFTVRPEEFAAKFRAGRIVFEPFPAGWTLRDAGGTLLMAVPLGAFGVVAARAQRIAQPTVVGLVLGLAVALAIEGAQLLSFSRTADATDLIMNATGVCLGVSLAARWADGPTAAFYTGPGFRLWPLAALLVWCVTLVIRHWSPFDFVTDTAYIKGRIPHMMRVPFYSYYWGFAPYVLMDATTKLLMAVPIGALLQLIWQPQTRVWRWVMAAGIVLLSGALFLGLELGQLMLPSRVPDQTDVYIGTLGAVIGVALVALVTRRRGLRGLSG